MDLKIKSMRSILIWAMLILMLPSCGTLNSVIEAKERGEGTTETYDISFDQAWELAKKSYRWAGADAIEEYKSEGYMLTSKGMNFVSSGSVMGTWIEDLGGGRCSVTCISQRRIKTQVATEMTETKYHKCFSTGVSIIKSGKELPLSAPDV